MNRNFHHELIPPLLQQVYSVVVGFIAWMLVPWLIPRLMHERPSHWVCRLYYPLSSIRKMSVTYAIVALRNIYKIYLNKTRIGLCYRTTWLSFTDDFYVFYPWYAIIDAYMHWLGHSWESIAAKIFILRYLCDMKMAEHCFRYQFCVQQIFGLLWLS